LRYEPGHITVSVIESGWRPVGGTAGSAPAGRSASIGDSHSVAQPGSLLAGSGLGLAGIAERVASCGGNLTVGPTPADGFAVTARLPSR
jgi:signal transduction histidine kinase